MTDHRKRDLCGRDQVRLFLWLVEAAAMERERGKAGAGPAGCGVRTDQLKNIFPPECGHRRQVHPLHVVELEPGETRPYRPDQLREPVL